MPICQMFKISNFKKRIASSGNALIEYGVIGTSIVATCILGIQIGANDVNKQFELVQSGMDQQSQQAAGSLAAQIGAQGSYIQAGYMQRKIEPVPAPPPTLDPSPGDYAEDIANQIATAGVNGTSFNISTELQALAEKLLSSGQATPEEANKILALAQQGFKLSELERQVEEASKSASSNEEFLNATVFLDGQALTVREAQGLIGFGSLAAPAQDIQANGDYMLQTDSASPETLTFIHLYQDAISGLSSKNPAAAGIITQLSSQISYLSDTVSNSIYGANDPNNSLDTLSSNMASEATLYDSTAICHLGSGCN